MQGPRCLSAETHSLVHDRVLYCIDSIVSSVPGMGGQKADDPCLFQVIPDNKFELPVCYSLSLS